MSVILACLSWVVSLFLSSDARSSVIKSSFPSLPAIEYARERFLLSLGGVSSDAAGLVAGLTIGERNLISAEAAEQMRVLSLTHLVAVSGANLAIVLAAVYFLSAAFGLPRNLRFICAILVMLLYVFLVGPESSVIRAATMAMCVMIGLWLGRGSPPLNSLALAIILLLLLDPALSRDIGFALSSVATAGLLILAPVFFEFLRQRIPEVLALAVAASASAQLFTTPVLLLIDPSLPLYSVVANILVEPVVAPITILGILAVVASLFSVPLAGAITFLASYLSSWIISVASELSSWPEARLHFLAGQAGVLLTALIVLLIGLSVTKFQRHGMVLRSIAAVLAVFGLAASAADRFRYESFASEWDLLTCDVGQGDAVLIRSQGTVALIDVGPDPAKIDRCLDIADVNRVDLLVLTHFDKDHVAGLEGALRDRELGNVLISGFEDDRPLVSVVQRQLSERGLVAALGRSGLSGRLGNGSWQILAPSATAEEAEDSNDASIIFSIVFDDWAFLGLGDLGEIGQQRLLATSMPQLSMLGNQRLVVKVAHHGSSDQGEEFAKFIAADYAIFSVGENPYGHPTKRAIGLYSETGAQILRSDVLGPFAIRFGAEVEVSVGGKLSS